MKRTSCNVLVIFINKITVLLQFQGLREILQISQNYGSIAQNVHGEDKGVQTEDINDNNVTEEISTLKPTTKASSNAHTSNSTS